MKFAKTGLRATAGIVVSFRDPCRIWRSLFAQSKGWVTFAGCLRPLRLDKFLRRLYAIALCQVSKFSGGVAIADRKTPLKKNDTNHE